MRLFQRAIRRARLPVRWTCGFNPRPRIAFPIALSVGIEGAKEPMEVVLDHAVSPASIQEALGLQLPDGVRILSVEEIAADASTRVVGVSYRIQLPLGQSVSEESVARLLACDRIDVARGRDRDKRVDIRPFVEDVRIGESSPGRGQTMTLDLAFTPQGSAKPGEILAWLNVAAQPGETAASITRTRVNLASSSPREEEVQWKKEC